MLAKYYLKPMSFVYIVSDNLLHYKLLIVTILSLIVLSYPVYSIMDIHSKIEKEDTHYLLNVSEKEQIDYKFNKLNVHFNSHKKDALKINEEIKKILVEYKMDIESMQWDKESNTINIVFEQQFLAIKKVIEEVVKLQSIYFDEVVLTKTNRNKFIQCVLNIQIL